MSRIVLVDPVAPAAVMSSPHANLAPVGSGPVALTDAMLNPAAAWGEGILDAVETCLTKWDPSIRMERVRRNHGVSSPGPEAWAASMAAVYRAIVIAAGD